MAALKIKIKIGENEFEADGPPDAVQTHVSTFVKLLGREEKTAEKEAPPAERVPESPPAIEKIIRVEGNVVSLNVASESPGEAVLALLLGYKVRGVPAVAGTQIMAGLRKSGQKIYRADYILKRYAMTGHIVASGKFRRRRYKLTTDGVEKAQKIAQALADCPE
ncbi:MAG TPA: hypothetical protein VE422_43155 [Terriglobia bacterium]|nr:hypothetical protein [Terriglobia bacterium]